jgi:Fur family transcriptional regulator, ferric uptake regulator
MAQAKPLTDDRFARFREHLRRERLKSTAQRDTIAKVFLTIHRHISVEELYQEVKRRNPRIGYATVYRTLKLLTECGLAVERHFRDGEARYESGQKGHHDHLICEACGKIIEFEEPRIEAMQEEVARRLSFRLTGHKMELYGLCRDCQRSRKTVASG